MSCAEVETVGRQASDLKIRTQSLGHAWIITKASGATPEFSLSLAVVTFRILKRGESCDIWQHGGAGVG